MDETQEIIRKKVLEMVEPDREIDDKELYEYIDQVILQENKRAMLSIEKRDKYRVEIFNALKRFDILQELLDDNTITEIMINGYKDIFIEKSGKITKWNKQFISKEKLEDIAQKIAGKSNRIVNESTPIVDTRLSDGSRVNIVLYPIAIEGPVITIRKFFKKPITIHKLIELGSLTIEAASFLKNVVEAKYNIFVSGGTGSGKTTFLNALSNFIPNDERIITIEDSAELQIIGVDNLVKLEARNANVEGTNAITIRELIRSSLRMRPDRIIVGEVRGNEAIDMLQAMNTGHDGSLSTGHSNSPKDMLSRLETMVLMGMDMPIASIRGQIASAIDIIVHLGRLRDKTRKVLEIVEILEYKDGTIGMNPLYKFQECGEEEDKTIKGELVKIGELTNTYKLHAAGFKFNTP